MKQPVVRQFGAFSLVEVVLAMGVVSFAVLATVGLLSIGNDTNRQAREESAAAQIAANQFERIRSLSAANFPVNVYVTQYFDTNLVELPETRKHEAAYTFHVTIPAPAAPGAADQIMNGEVRYPATAPNPTIVRFTTLMNVPKPTPTPGP
jgi:uncharacterized protein (TIGR02598 family)